MIRDATFTAGDDEAGARIAHAVTARLPSTCRSLVLRALENGSIRVNGTPVRKGRKLAAGDNVFIATLMETADRRAVPDPAVPLEVIHEEALFLVVNKPGGMPVHPIEPGETGTLVNALLARYPELGLVGGDPLFPAAVHRIDGDTSGVLLVARSQEAYGTLRDQFAARLVAKEYTALAVGDVAAPMTIENYLVHAPRPSHRMRVIERGRQQSGAMRAITECRPKERLRGFTLLDVGIRTGVTHQIRCQLAWAGHPIAGDTLYGGVRPGAYEGRLFLHARRIEFNHPATGLRTAFEAPLPRDLSAPLDALRQSS